MVGGEAPGKFGQAPIVAGQRLGQLRADEIEDSPFWVILAPVRAMPRMASIRAVCGTASGTMCGRAPGRARTGRKVPGEGGEHQRCGEQAYAHVGGDLDRDDQRRPD